MKVSSDLTTWTSAETTEVGNTVSAGLRTINVRDNEPIGGPAPRRFVRLEIVLP